MKYRGATEGATAANPACTECMKPKPMAFVTKSKYGLPESLSGRKLYTAPITIENKESKAMAYLQKRSGTASETMAAHQAVIFAALSETMPLAIKGQSRQFFLSASMSAS